ncbi:MAG: glycosyltransferase [Bacteroidales bacterium]|nr:glycosyltransferase [Bacteroidales bacterium]
MNILVNLNSSLKNKKDPFHGGNEYSNRVCTEIIESNSSWKHDLFFYCNTEELLEPGLRKKINEDDYCKLLTQREYNQLEDAIKNLRIERLFDPLGGIEIGQYSLENIEVVYTIHGLRPIEMPTDINEYYLESRIKYIIKSLFSPAYKKKVKRNFKASIELKAKSKKLIVVSNHTKYTIISEFNIDPGDVCVLYSPEKAFPIISEAEEEIFFNRIEDIDKEKYYLIVSSKRWIKNTFRAIKAFDELISHGQIKHKIVLTGANDKVKRLIKKKNMFCILDYVEAGDLEILYKNAFALVYPSLNEGFGYPPLEAMKYGTPVISASITSIPEVVGDASLSFNPLSVLELKARLLHMQNDKELYDRLVVQGQKRYQIINRKQKEDLRKIVEIILS